MPRTRSQDLQSAKQVESPEALPSKKKQNSRTAVSSSDEEDSLTVKRDEREKSMFVCMMEVEKYAGDDRGRQHPNVRLNSSGTSRRVVNDPVSRTDVYQIVKNLMQKTINKLDNRVADIAEQTVLDALETCDVDKNEAFIKSALKSALNGLLVSILDDATDIRDSFENTIIQVATAPKSLAAIVSGVA